MASQHQCASSFLTAKLTLLPGMMTLRMAIVVGNPEPKSRMLKVAETLDCMIVVEHPASDHYILVGEVNAKSPSCCHDGAPLLYFKGKYRRLHTSGD
jgi:hypothetical protein